MSSEEVECCPAQVAVEDPGSSKESNLDTEVTISEHHYQLLLKEFREIHPFIESCWIAAQEGKQKCIVAVVKRKRRCISETTCSLPSSYEGLPVTVCEDANNFRALDHFTDDGFPKYTIPIGKMMELQKAILNKAYSLMDKHSNLRAICGSPYKYFDQNGRFEVDVCIALYCRGKGFIPLGETEFPEDIEGIRTDVREGYFRQGMTNSDLPGSKDRHENLRIGAQITGMQTGFGGTLGGFIRLPGGGTGFLTCAHVVYDMRDLILDYHNQTVMFGGHVLSPYKSSVLGSEVGQPDQSAHNKVGTVYTHAFRYGNRTEISVDAACVSITDLNRIPTDGFMTNQENVNLRISGFHENSPPSFVRGSVVNHCENNRFGRVVIKCGAESGLTPGMLEVDATILRLENPEMASLSPSTRGRIVLHQQYVVRPMKDFPFFTLGDSGSLVFTNDGNDLKCFGMAIGQLTDGGCIVTPIHSVLASLNLTSLLSFPSTDEESSPDTSDEGDDEEDDDDDNGDDGFNNRHKTLHEVKRKISGKNVANKQIAKELNTKNGNSCEKSKYVSSTALQKENKTKNNSYTELTSVEDYNSLAAHHQSLFKTDTQLFTEQ